jgi:hypothetical protein
VRLGWKAFYSASAFNANIGAWNTACVTSLAHVCAALSGPTARQRKRDALGGMFGEARAVVRGGAADARARVCAQTCGHAHARVSTCIGQAARSKDGLHACVYMYGYVRICM